MFKPSIATFLAVMISSSFITTAHAGDKCQDSPTFEVPKPNDGDADNIFNDSDVINCEFVRGLMKQGKNIWCGRKFINENGKNRMLREICPTACDICGWFEGLTAKQQIQRCEKKSIRKNKCLNKGGCGENCENKKKIDKCPVVKKNNLQEGLDCSDYQPGLECDNKRLGHVYICDEDLLIWTALSNSPTEAVSTSSPTVSIIDECPEDLTTIQEGEDCSAYEPELKCKGFGDNNVVQEYKCEQIWTLKNKCPNDRRQVGEGLDCSRFEPDLLCEGKGKDEDYYVCQPDDDGNLIWTEPCSESLADIREGVDCSDKRPDLLCPGYGDDESVVQTYSCDSNVWSLKTKCPNDRRRVFEGNDCSRFKVDEACEGKGKDGELFVCEQDDNGALVWTLDQTS